jgi:hypothetical protein
MATHNCSRQVGTLDAALPAFQTDPGTYLLPSVDGHEDQLVSRLTSIALC